MTTSPPDRLDRIEQIIAAVAEQQQLTQRQLELTRSIVESNAKAITALGQTVIDDREETAETASRNMVQGRDNERMIEVLISEGQENIRQHQAFTERFDRMLLEIQRIWQRIAG